MEHRRSLQGPGSQPSRGGDGRGREEEGEIPEGRWEPRRWARGAAFRPWRMMTRQENWDGMCLEGASPPPVIPEVPDALPTNFDRGYPPGNARG